MESKGSRRSVPLLTYLLSESVRDVPTDVESDLRRRVVDTFGAMIAGHRVDGIDVTTSFVTEMFGEGPSTILNGTGLQRCVPGTALANGLAANALDIDDGSRKAEGHPAAVIVPAALAAAEAVEAPVGAFLDAILASYEVAVRIAPAMKNWTGMWNGSGAWGAVGAAGAVSRLTGLSKDSTWHALGIAEFNAPLAPNQRSVMNPGSSMTKDGIGWGCYVGTNAALLAERGLTGSGTIIDTTSLDDPDLASLGERYYLMESYYKPYPGCRWAHPGIDAALALLDKHAIDPGDIDRVWVHTFQEAIDLGTRYPDNPDQAQYSYAFLLAAALVKGDWLTPADLNARNRQASTVRDMIDRISFIHDDTAQNQYETSFTARVSIEVDGERYRSELTHPLGSPERPMSPADHRKKQTLLIDRYLGDGSAAELRQRLGDRDLSVRELIASIGLSEQ